MKWHVPNDEELSFANTVAEKFLVPELNFLKQISSSNEITKYVDSCIFTSNGITVKKKCWVLKEAWIGILDIPLLNIISLDRSRYCVMVPSKTLVQRTDRRINLFVWQVLVAVINIPCEARQQSISISFDVFRWIT